MIEDLERLGAGPPLEADLCLVGGGAAGISIAQALADTGVKVILLEGGGLEDEDATQALYAGESVGQPMTLDVGRYRVFGGSTTRWTGRCARLDPIDFEARPWVENSGWPIDAEALAPWYEAARPLCGFPEPWTDDARARQVMGVAPLPLDRQKLESFTWRYAPQGNRVYIDWGKRHRAKLQGAPNIRVLLHANVVGFDAGPDGRRVQAVTARTLGGVEREVRAQAFVLACGGVENARLLLASDETVPGGLGTGRDAVGRYLMQHPRGQIARIMASPAQARALQDQLNIFATLGGLQYEFGLALPEEVQRREGLLNASTILTYAAAAASPWEAFKAGGRAVRDRRFGDGVRDLARAARDPGAVVGNLWRRGVRKRHALLDVGELGLLIDLEQTPDRDSRVTLSDSRDALGQRRPRVDWRIGDQERRTARRFAELVRDEFARLGLGRVEPEAWLDEEGPLAPGRLEGTYHHIATTRMAATPADGVVDGDARVHGVDNLYVMGCSVFSTGGHANPTFTIVALALRLAEHLRTRLAA